MLHLKEFPVVRYGQLEEVSYHLQEENTGLILDIVQNKLYSDKITAIHPSCHSLFPLSPKYHHSQNPF